MKKTLSLLLVFSLLLMMVFSTSTQVYAYENFVGVTTGNLNVRTGPGIEYKIVNVYPKDTQVTIVDKNGDWYLLNNGYWIHSKWVQKKSAEVHIHKYTSYEVSHLTGKVYRKCECGRKELIDKLNFFDSLKFSHIMNNQFYTDLYTYYNSDENDDILYMSPPNEIVRTKKGFQFSGDVVLSAIHAGLDLGGLVPVVGEPLDGLNAVIYLVDKDYTNAALSGISIIPIVGYIGTGGKVVKTTSKVLKVVRYADHLNDYDGVVKYIKKFGKLPDNYVTKQVAQAAGWISKNGNLAKVLPGKSIGGDIFKNTRKLLPDAPGRVWMEADINYVSGFRNKERLIYSNDGLFYKTDGHYDSFTKID